MQLIGFIETIEKAVGKKAEKNIMGMQDGDVVATCANIDALVEATGFKPAIPSERWNPEISRLVQEVSRL